VTVASQIELEDPIENAAAQIVKDAALRTSREAGDGTTTATVIASAIIEKALYYVSTKANPMDLKRGIDMAVADVIEQVYNSSTPVNGRKDIFNIARISSNNDDKVGNMIADIFEKVGKSGAIRLEETQMSETVVEVVEGCQFNSGYLSPNFVNNATKRIADYQNVAVLITDKLFQESFDDLVPALNLIVEASNEKEQAVPLLIICGGMEGEPLGTLVINKMKQKFPVVAVTAPEFGTDRIEILEDIAVITGGTVISEEKGGSIKDMTMSDFGIADRVIVDNMTTTLIGRSGDPIAIEQRIATIEEQIVEDKNHNQTWRLNKRIATLTGGVGVVYVGGNSESEMKDAYYRIEDALAATKASMEGGYVAGGGIAYLRASDAIDDFPLSNRDQELGYQCLLEALESPLKTIAENCGKKGDVVVDQVEGFKNLNRGYDALEDEYGDMIKKGIIDPTKVVVTAIKNAASVAGMLITTNCVINDKPKK
jgi:chaperonin GroEL